MCDMEELPGSGFSMEHSARRYEQIHHVVEQMGGWANFRHWVKVHSKNYFDTLDVAVGGLKEIAGFDVKTEGVYPGSAKKMCEIAKETLEKLDVRTK